MAKRPTVADLMANRGRHQYAMLRVETLDEAAVIAHCAQHMAGFKTPKRVVFTDTLPKNPSGKLLKRDLRLRYA